MKCFDFERLWNERLDHVGTAEETAIARRLDAHAATCESCRAIAARYRTLEHVISALGPPPAASADFVDRFLASQTQQRDTAFRIHPLRSLFIPLATAAALVAAVFLSGRPGSLVVERPGALET